MIFIYVNVIRFNSPETQISNQITIVLIGLLGRAAFPKLGETQLLARMSPYFNSSPTTAATCTIRISLSIKIFRTSERSPSLSGHGPPAPSRLLSKTKIVS
jgi:hypothetical protein